jgi:hypothetical protein
MLLDSFMNDSSANAAYQANVNSSMASILNMNGNMAVFNSFTCIEIKYMTVTVLFSLFNLSHVDHSDLEILFRTHGMKVNGYQSLVMLLIYQVSVPLYKPRDFI